MSWCHGSSSACGLNNRYSFLTMDGYGMPGITKVQANVVPGKGQKASMAGRWLPSCSVLIEDHWEKVTDLIF